MILPFNYSLQITTTTSLSLHIRNKSVDTSVAFSGVNTLLRKGPGGNLFKSQMVGLDFINFNNLIAANLEKVDVIIGEKSQVQGSTTGTKRFCRIPDSKKGTVRVSSEGDKKTGIGPTDQWRIV